MRELTKLIKISSKMFSLTQSRGVPRDGNDDHVGDGITPNNILKPHVHLTALTVTHILIVPH